METISSFTETLNQTNLNAKKWHLMTGIVDNSPNGIIIVDKEHRLRFANKNAAMMFGFEVPQAFIKDGYRTVEDLLPKEKRDEHYNKFEEYYINPLTIKLHARPNFILKKLSNDEQFEVKMQLSPYADDIGIFGKPNEIYIIAYLMPLK